MRIGVDFTAAARQMGGIGRYARELLRALLALDGRNTYVLFAATGGLKRPAADLQHLAAVPNVALRTLPLSDDWLARLWQRARLPLPVEALTGRLDLFYSPDFVLPPTRRATRTLLTVHDLSFLRTPEAFVPPLRAYLERVVPRAIQRAGLVLADSAHTRTDLLDLLDVPAERVRVLYSGVEARFTPQAEPGERERLQARYGVGEHPYLLGLGTIQPRKNYVRLIEAFVRLPAAARAGHQLLIAGGPGWMAEPIYAAAARHPEAVRILGFVEDADLPALYRGATLFAYPSLYEGFGLPPLEAMACGVPVVASSTSSLPEVVGEAGLLVDPLDVEALSDALGQVLDDTALRSDLAARGRVQAGRFTWERAAGELLGMFAPDGNRTIIEPSTQEESGP